MSGITFTHWMFWAAFAVLFVALSAWQKLTSPKLQAPGVRKALLLTFSLGFYWWVAGRLVLILLVSILINHILARGIAFSKGKQRWVVTSLAVGFNLLVLCTFKYAYFFADWWPNPALESSLQSWRLDQWMLPLGISFYTFQAISYVVDVNRGTLERPASLLSFASYITFFPQLVAGPIVRAKQFIPQLEASAWTSPRTEETRHVRLITAGFLKKVLLGDLLGSWIVDPVFAEPQVWSSFEIWMALYGYSLQVYADFSGYTDMAKGMAGLLGINLPENFQFPYRAHSPAEFWRRWHMTLSKWWKDYLYIPLGGNRNLSGFSVFCALGGIVFGIVKWQNIGGSLVIVGLTLLISASMLLFPKVQIRAGTAINVMIVMLLGGLWHGAHINFITWGALNGLVLAAWVLLGIKGQSRWSRVVGWVVTFHTVVISRIWFRSGSLIGWDDATKSPHPEKAWQTAKSMFSQLWNPPVALDTSLWSIAYIAGMALLVTGYALHFLSPQQRNVLHLASVKSPMWLTWTVWILAASLSVWAQGDTTRPFIYWQF